MLKRSGSDCKSKFCYFFKQNFDSFLQEKYTSKYFQMKPASLRRAKSVRCGFKGELNIKLKFKLMKHLLVSLQVTNPVRQGLASRRKRVLRSQQRFWHEA